MSKLVAGRVVIRPRDDKGFDIVWLEGDIERSVFRKAEERATEYAAQQQARLDRNVAESELPFGDTVLGADGTGGEEWLQLLWSAALTVAQNPGKKPVQLAAQKVAACATAARKFIASDRLADGGGITADDVMAQVKMMIAAELSERKDVTAEEKEVVLRVLKGGKAA
jgi:hypothetical protein